MTANALVADRERLPGRRHGRLPQQAGPHSRDSQVALRGAGAPSAFSPNPPAPAAGLAGSFPGLDPVDPRPPAPAPGLTGRALVGEIIDSFLGEMPRRLARLREALTAGDGEALAFAAHSLKGSRAQLGALRLAALSHAVELQGRSGSLVAAAALVDEVERARPRRSTALSEERGAGRPYFGIRAMTIAATTAIEPRIPITIPNHARPRPCFSGCWRMSRIASRPQTRAGGPKIPSRENRPR